MELLRFTNLTRAYGARTVFERVAGVVRDGDKIALVGPNGAGKSSLVRTIAGVDEPDGGTIARARDTRLGYMAQDAPADESITLHAALDAAFARVRAEESHVRDLELQLTAVSERGDDDAMTALLEKYGDAREAFDRHGGEGLEKQMRATISAFDFDESDLDRPTSGFSGGQRTRAMLARTLLERPDWLILDEPTNHLDIETVRWLEDFIIDDPRATLVVSHDRYFLERVATVVWDLSGGELVAYNVKQGKAYTDFLEQRQIRRDEQRRVYEVALAEHAREQAVIDELKTHGSHNYSHVRSREKKMSKMPEAPPPDTDKPSIGMTLVATRRATNGFALEVKGLSKAYNEPLFNNLTFDIKRGERVAIVGPNGAGKSTLLKILSGEIAADKGNIRFGPGLKTAYFAQDSADELPTGVRAVDAVLDAAKITEEEARGLLGRMRLGGEAADKPVEAFSGGERRRIMLARLMAQKADCLLLDEPTNDLDIPSREALESILAEYDGALLVVSHDRYLLKRLAETTLWIRDGLATPIQGGYDAFESAALGHATNGKAPEPKAKPAPKVVEPPQPRASVKEIARRKRELEAAEKRVAEIDRKRGELSALFAAPDLYDNPEAVAKLRNQLSAIETAASEALHAWEAAMEAVETDEAVGVL